MDSSPGISNGVHTETQTEANRTTELVQKKCHGSEKIRGESLSKSSCWEMQWWEGGNQLRVWGIVDAYPKKTKIK